MIKERLLALLYPGRCPLCGRILPYGTVVHDACLRELPVVRGLRCDVCGKPIEEGTRCEDCTENAHVFRRGIGVFPYAGNIKRAVLQWKFAGRREYGQTIAAIVYAYAGEAVKAFGPYVIVPVPMYLGKIRARGFNQAKDLADALGRLLGWPVRDDLCCRTRPTRAMKRLRSRDRGRNLSGAFTAGKARADGMRILIVDDIYTTGKTVDEVSRVLYAQGACEVSFLAVCIGGGFMIQY